MWPCPQNFVTTHTKLFLMATFEIRLTPCQRAEPVISSHVCFTNYIWMCIEKWTCIPRETIANSCQIAILNSWRGSISEVQYFLHQHSLGMSSSVAPSIQWLGNLLLLHLETMFHTENCYEVQLVTVAYHQMRLWEVQFVCKSYSKKDNVNYAKNRNGEIKHITYTNVS
jgi:hypothetical protein